MNMKLDTKDHISKDQTEIVEELGEYFATIANGIGGVSGYSNSADQELPTSWLPAFQI